MNRDLDIQIAINVFGVEVEALHQKGGWRIDYRAKDNTCNDPIIAMGMVDGYRLRNYSGDIKAAFDAIEHLYPDDEWYEIEISKTVSEGFSGYVAAIRGYAYGESEKSKAEALCILALEIVKKRRLNAIYRGM
jgi:hypothetical protein